MSSHLVLLDNEAVQALGDPTHPKHPHVVSHVQVVAGRKRRAMPITIAVPTAIRVEAGWNRNSPAWPREPGFRSRRMPCSFGITGRGSGRGRWRYG